MRKGNGVVNRDVMVEEGDSENNITSPETDRTESARLRFPNPPKFETDFSAIYQIDKIGVRGKYNPRISIRDHHSYNQEMNSDHPRYNQEINSDHPKYNQAKSNDQPKERNLRFSWRSSSLDQSSISCYNELNRNFKSNCDLHFSTESRSGSLRYKLKFQL